MEVARLARSRLRPDDSDESLLLLLFPGSEVREEVEDEREFREGLSLLGCPPARVDTECAGDVRFGGAANLFRVAAELAGHAAGDGEGEVADVKRIPGSLQPVDYRLSTVDFVQQIVGGEPSEDGGRRPVAR